MVVALIEMTQKRGYQWKELGSRIRLAREQADITREHTAAIIGVAPQTVWYWESGRSRPQAHRLQALAKTYGVTVDWLLGNGPLPEGEEEEILRIYRRIPEERRPLLRQILEAAAKYENEEEQVDPGAS